jgi:hypothetical protein
MEIKIYVNHEEEKVFTEKQYKEYLKELSDEYYHSTYEFNEWCEIEGVLPSDIMFGNEALRERLASTYKDYCEKTSEETALANGWTEIIMEV